MRPAVDRPVASLLRLSGWLLVGGFLLNAVVTMAFHPSGNEDDHAEIFTEYADSGGWIATHLGQFAGVTIALAGLLVLYRTLTIGGEGMVLARFAAAATIASGAVWAVLQGLDGVALKNAVDTWVASSGAEKADAFSNAETVRWLEWGFQSYFRLLLGLGLALFGVAVILSDPVPGWLGWVAVLGGLLFVATGIDVGYHGLESGFQDLAAPISQLALVVFALGILVTGTRGRDPLPTAR
jgi:hypothetical protein